MIIKNRRFGHGVKSSGGCLLIDDKPFSFIVEDEPRIEKVKGETRIWAGTYKLGICKEDSPLTVKHRKTYNKDEEWFKYHIEILNVNDFISVYFHSGNSESHTDGCQMPNYNLTITPEGEFSGGNSFNAVKEFYKIVYPLLENDEDVLYIIEDCDI